MTLPPGLAQLPMPSKTLVPVGAATGMAPAPAAAMQSPKPRLYLGAIKDMFSGGAKSPKSSGRSSSGRRPGSGRRPSLTKRVGAPKEGLQLDLGNVAREPIHYLDAATTRRTLQEIAQARAARIEPLSSERRGALSWRQPSQRASR